jgi:hypothetical protein
MLGDINADGNLNVLDIVSMVSYILGGADLTSEVMSCSDMNQDDSLNVLDIVMAVEIILGN